MDDFIDYREQVRIAFGQANSADVIKGGDAATISVCSTLALSIS
ncbi:hypothetical protein JCM19235_6094 [Vibrio maritimus]|uniref:Uncharacterized protein n=1 Tax=Vibrio maritimus TaxID=990268 RepID=A0A090RQL3_9VIBR|nr:hypothetical protein JCM19235_6094 [Vibrio maritimus]